MSNVIVIGAGAAGMMAAYSASLCGHSVIILDKNEKCGKKIYITGKGRCNLTNNCDVTEFFGKVVTNPKFLYSSVYSFTPEQAMEIFENDFSLPIKTERGGRVFPVSDKSSDVISALVKAMKGVNVIIKLNTKVLDVKKIDDEFIVKCSDRIYKADSVIIATGGVSYPSTGSTGDGYDFAKRFGHTIIEAKPALVPFNVKEEWVKSLQGLALKNISVKFFRNNKMIYEDFGEMLFTHFGVSGPVILSAGSYLAKYNIKEISMILDCKPALSEAELDRRIKRDFEQIKNVHFSNSLKKLLPARMIEIIVRHSGIKPDKPVNQVTAAERWSLAHLIKNIPLSLISTRGFNEAIITSGGVNVKEINPSTMESKIVKGLHFAGEVIDVDAVTGGYNLQIAWSTGYAAGTGVAYH